MRGFLASKCKAVIFSMNGKPCAYALFKDEPEDIYLRQLFVRREQRRRGLDRAAVAMLKNEM